MRFGTNQNLNKVYNPIRKRSVGPVGSSGSNTESKWTPNGFQKRNTSPVKGTGDDKTKKSADYSMFYFIGTLLLGIFVLEVAISRDGVNASTK